MNARAPSAWQPKSEAPAASSGRLLQRQCACGYHTLPGAACAACAREQPMLQRQAAGQQAVLQVVPTVPPIVEDALRAPGQALDGATRASMEARFRRDFSRVRLSVGARPMLAGLAMGRPDDAYEREADRVAARVMRAPAPSHPQRHAPGVDFSGVRIHTDARAAASAEAVAARAYTVSAHIVMGAGQYAPHTASGGELLAHELAHVIQQTGGSQGAASLRLSAMPTPRIARWALAGNTATSDRESDVLWNLARRVSGDPLDWPCIWPINMRSPRAWEDDYWHYVRIGDTFDVSNLTADAGTTGTFSYHMTGDDLRALEIIYGGADPVNLYQEIAMLSGSGHTPIQQLTVTGHTAGDRVWGDAGDFSPTGFRGNQPAPSGAGAHNNMGPHRCWFTRNATVRIVGCSSQTVAQPFARAFLRTGAQALGTNHWLCGWHQTTPTDERFISVEGPPCNWPPTAPRLGTAAAVDGAGGLWTSAAGAL